MKQYLALFRNRNFLLLYAGSAISNVGDFFNMVALVKVLSADPTRLGLLLALVSVAKFLPGLILGPVAGVVADRVSRRTILVVTDLVRAVLVAGLVFTDSPAIIVTLVTLAASAAAFNNPAGAAVLPSIVRADQFVTANALYVVTNRACQLVGSALGAMVLIGLGVHNVFWIDAASFVACALLALPVLLPKLDRPVDAAAADARSQWQTFTSDLKEAVSFLQGSLPMRRLLVVFGIIILGDSATGVLTVPFYTQVLHLAPERMGLIWAVYAGASMVGALVMGAVGSRVHWQYLITFGILNAYVMKMGSVLSPTVGISLVFYTIQGLGSGALNIGLNTATGLLVPGHVRGRIAGAIGMLQSAIYVTGTLITGFLSVRMGTMPVLIGFISCYLVAALYGQTALRRAVARPVVQPSAQ